MDLVTVIMATCNTEKEYLGMSVESILAQTSQNIELIVIVDGGKYDGCLSKIKDNRLKVVVHKNTLGLAVRLNEAIKLAKGKYIVRMDSDDYALPDRLEKQYKFMEKHPEIDICGMFAKKFGNESGFLINANTTNKYIETELFINNILLHPTIMFRKSAISKYNIKYDEGFSCAQDYELWSRLCGTVKFAIMSEVGLMYRVHDGQISKSKRKKQIEFRNRIIKNNIKKMKLAESDLKYIGMLIDLESSLDTNKLADFIKRVLQKNKNVHVYDQKALKDVMYRHLFVVLLKNHKFGLAVRYLRSYTVYYVVKKKFFVFRSKIRMHRYLRQYKKEGILI